MTASEKLFVSLTLSSQGSKRWAPGAPRSERRKEAGEVTVELGDCHAFTCFQFRASRAPELCPGFYILCGPAFPKVKSPPSTVEREVRHAGEGDFRVPLLPAPSPALPRARGPPGSSDASVCLGV